MQISKTKKHIIVMIKESRTYFDNLNNKSEHGYLKQESMHHHDERT